MKITKEPNELAGYLKAHNITQRYIAELIGKSAVTVNHKIYGKSFFNQDEISILVDSLGIPIELFLNSRQKKED
ncbi:helix-turn-helix domain-containing protein [Xylocopilactobacillus apis]|uniref:HTH cro/C1-type domain-containing protein n=1 Tax=Xylocopilactobacillus apis TaxID=2932183 RepID=A0AAU9D283_9LACO|nr:helix-turn-helix transcriptional regulator [Xylocopilactobacillus apis]BDR56591.1 hypothetical protein KIMC2_11530 [Xylocopilactobacillus apis]